MTMTSLQHPTALPIADVIVMSDRRPVNAAAVNDLARSIEAIGLQTPITVRRDRDELILVTGRHRLEAARSLGWSEIPAIFLEGDADDGRLWEISENLHRAELTVLERAEHVAEWVRITAEKAKAQVAPSGHTGGRADQGINAAVRELGVERTEAQRSVRIDAITPEAKAAAIEAGLADNQAALLAVAAKPKAEQKATVGEIKAKKSAPRKPRAKASVAEPTAEDRKPISPALLLPDSLIEYVKKYVGAAADRGLLTADLVSEIIPTAILDTGVVEVPAATSSMTVDDGAARQTALVEASLADRLAEFSDADLLAEIRRRVAPQFLVRVVPNTGGDVLPDAPGVDEPTDTQEPEKETVVGQPPGDAADEQAADPVRPHQASAPRVRRDDKPDARRDRVRALLATRGWERKQFSEHVPTVPWNSFRMWLTGTQGLAERYHGDVDTTLDRLEGGAE